MKAKPQKKALRLEKFEEVSFGLPIQRARKSLEVWRRSWEFEIGQYDSVDRWRRHWHVYFLEHRPIVQPDCGCKLHP